MTMVYLDIALTDLQSEFHLARSHPRHHSVRGFLSGTLKKKMGLRVDSAKLQDGRRTYRVTSK